MKPLELRLEVEKISSEFMKIASVIGDISKCQINFLFLGKHQKNISAFLKPDYDQVIYLCEHSQS